MTALIMVLLLAAWLFVQSNKQETKLVPIRIKKDDDHRIR